MTDVLSPELVRLSKRISRVLRHAPESVGLRLDEQGWVPVEELLSALGQGVTRAQLDAVVSGNDKRRFAVEIGEHGVERIRASQGHSQRVAVDLGLAAATPPGVLFHGTPRGNVASVVAQGLRPGRRHHVHLSPDECTARTVGRRRHTDVAVLRIRAGAAAAAGQLFFRSDNGVWLTAEVPPEFIDPPAE